MTGRVDVVAGVIALHYRRDIGSCACGWGEATGDLGRSHAAHVAELALAAADRLAAPGAVAAAPPGDGAKTLAVPVADLEMLISVALGEQPQVDDSLADLGADAIDAWEDAAADVAERLRARLAEDL